MKLIKGSIYKSGIHRRGLVRYLGKWQCEETNLELHQFEYLKVKESVSGYGQTDEQVVIEKYKLAIHANILYGVDE